MILGCVYFYKFMEISLFFLYNMNNYKIFKDKVYYYCFIVLVIWMLGINE